MVGLGRLELPTSRLSSARSNQLSYKPLAENGNQTADDGTEMIRPRSSDLRMETSVVRMEEEETKAAASRMMRSD